MAVVSREQLRQMQAMIEANFDCTLYVLTPQRERASGARTLETYPTYTEPGVPSYPCACLRITDPTEGVTREQIAAGVAWRLNVPTDADVPMDARLVVTGTDVDGIAWVKSLDVVAPTTPHSWRVRGKVIATETLASGAV